MSTEHLSATDFAAMGVHKPLLEDEIAEIHPQAVVDKTDATYDGVPLAVDGETYPHEEPLPDNVAILETTTSHDLPAVEVLRNAFNANMEEMVICGIDGDGNEHVFRTNADLAPAIFHLQRAQHLLNKQHDEVHTTHEGE